MRDRSLSETWVDTITKRADQAEGMEESCISVRILIVVFENNLSMLGAKANSFRGHTLTRRYWPKDNTTSIGPLHLMIQTSLSFATTTDTLLQCTWSLQIQVMCLFICTQSVEVRSDHRWFLRMRDAF